MIIPLASVYLCPLTPLVFLYGCSPTLPILPFPPLTASPPIPHASLTQLSYLPFCLSSSRSLSHLPPELHFQESSTLALLPVSLRACLALPEAMLT